MWLCRHCRVHKAPKTILLWKLPEFPTKTSGKKSALDETCLRGRVRLTKGSSNVDMVVVLRVRELGY